MKSRRFPEVPTQHPNHVYTKVLALEQIFFPGTAKKERKKRIACLHTNAL